MQQRPKISLDGAKGYIMHLQFWGSTFNVNSYMSTMRYFQVLAQLQPTNFNHQLNHVHAHLR